MEVKARKEMDPAYQWDFSHIFSTREAWEKAYAEAGEAVAAIAALRALKMPDCAHATCPHACPRQLKSNSEPSGVSRKLEIRMSQFSPTPTRKIGAQETFSKSGAIFSSSPLATI